MKKKIFVFLICISCLIGSIYAAKLTTTCGMEIGIVSLDYFGGDYHEWGLYCNEVDEYFCGGQY